MSPSFRSAVLAVAGREVRLGPVHGDPRPSNVLMVGREVWLVDWEYAGCDAPRDGDVVAALLNQLTEERPWPGLGALLARLLDACAEHEVASQDVALTVLYLSALGNSWARRLTGLPWPRAASADVGGDAR